MGVEELDLSVCCIKGCDKPSVALGLCVNHYRRNRKYGSPVALKSHSGQFRGMSPERRFDLQVARSDGCWGWRGARDNDRYPSFRGLFDGVMYNRAHRFSYVLHTGEHPGDKQVLHRCDNPTCTNPDHLFLGTNADNMADKTAKGRNRVPKGEASPHAKITEVQASAIRGDARSYAVVAADYGVSPATIGDIKSGKSWTHLTAAVSRAKRVSPRRGKSDKITPEIVREIRAGTETGKVLAERYGISPQTITDIRKGRSWRHVT